MVHSVRMATKSTRCQWIATAAFAIAITGCTNATPEAGEAKISEGKLKVCASIPPVAFVVKAIGGERVSVSTLLMPGQSPETYQPTSKQMVELSNFKCLFGVGVPFESQLVASVASSMPDLRIVDLSVGLQLLPAEFKCKHSHHDGGEHTHDHGDHLDPHLWMKPQLMIPIAESIHAELCQLSPGDTPQFDANLKSLRQTLEELDAEIRKSLASLRSRSFYVYHPSMGYFADAYNLQQIAIEKRGKEPTAKELDALVKRARSDDVKLIFVQPQFSQRAAKSVAQQIDGSVATVDPLSDDYVENLRHIAQQIKDALGTNDSANEVPPSGTNGAGHD